MPQLIEHEAMHLETLLYIAIQASNRLLPAPGYSVPDFTSLSRSWDASVAAEGEARKTILEFEATKITLGLDDDDEDLQGYDEKHVMGWDVESMLRALLALDKVLMSRLNESSSKPIHPSCGIQNRCSPHLQFILSYFPPIVLYLSPFRFIPLLVEIVGRSKGASRGEECPD